MRIRITQWLSGSIEGIQLRRFRPGEIYDVSAALGCYLMVEGTAELVVDSSPALVLPLELSSRRQSIVSQTRSERAKAAGRQSRRRLDSLAKRLGPLKHR